jgi:hypothetical protein
MYIAVDVIHKGTPSPTGERAYEKSLLRRRDETLARVRECYEEWKRTKIYKIPQISRRSSMFPSSRAERPRY